MCDTRECHVRMICAHPHRVRMPQVVHELRPPRCAFRKLCPVPHEAFRYAPVKRFAPCHMKSKTFTPRVHTHNMSSEPIDFVAAARGKDKKRAATSDYSRPSTSPRRHEKGDTSSAAKSKYGRKAGGKSSKTQERVPAETEGDVSAGAGASATTGTSTSDAKPSAMRQSLLYAFANMLSQFLVASATVWPMDATINHWNHTFNAAVSAATSDKAREAFFRTLITGFHEAFKEHYADIAAENAALFDNEHNEWMRAVHAKTKFTDANPQIRAQVWQYASFLARMSNMYAMYSKCPDSLLGHIHTLAEQLGASLQRGEMSLADLNPLTLGQHLMKALTPEDLKSFGTTMMGDSNLDGIIAMLSSMVSMIGGSTISTSDIMSMASMASAAEGSA